MFKVIRLGAIALILTLIHTTCFATAQPYTFLFHKNPVFVETGSFFGEGILNALLSGYDEIHSIELAPKYYVACKERFQKQKQVNIHLGDSGKILYDVIKEINDPITFWLDAQFAGWDMAFGGK